MPSEELDHPVTRPIRRLRVVPNPAAGRTPGGRHRKPETGEIPVPVEPTTSDVVPAQRMATLTVPPPHGPGA